MQDFELCTENRLYDPFIYPGASVSMVSKKYFKFRSVWPHNSCPIYLSPVQLFSLRDLKPTFVDDTVEWVQRQWRVPERMQWSPLQSSLFLFMQCCLRAQGWRAFNDDFCSLSILHRDFSGLLESLLGIMNCMDDATDRVALIHSWGTFFWICFTILAVFQRYTQTSVDNWPNNVQNALWDDSYGKHLNVQPFVAPVLTFWEVLLPSNSNELK